MLKLTLALFIITRKYNQGNFADSELKAAKFVLRLLHFDSQMQPKSGQGMECMSERLSNFISDLSLE